MWTEPKTDWSSEDFFNAGDFNRIKNNLAYLRDLACVLYKDFSINDLGDDRVTKDLFYASEINKMEANLVTIAKNTYKPDYGESPAYYDNGYTMDYTELNRLESATLDLYNQLNNGCDGRRMFVWNFEGGM